MGSRTSPCSAGRDGEATVAVPLLIGHPRGDVARGGGVELDRSAQDGAHPHDHRRIVQQEGEGGVLLQHVVDEVVLSVWVLLTAAAALVALGPLVSLVEGVGELRAFAS